MHARSSFLVVSFLGSLSLAACSGADFATAPMADTEIDSDPPVEAGAEETSDSGAEATADTIIIDSETIDSAIELDSDGIDSAVADSSIADSIAADTTVADTFVPDVMPDLAIDTTKPCDESKTPLEDSCVLRDDLGIFVSPSKGNDGNPGTKTSPVKTLAQAQTLASIGKHRVYACAETFVEQVTLRDGVNLFGGIDCTTWKVTGKSVIAPPAAPVIGGKSIANVRVDHFEVRAPDALAGKSSIAVSLDAVSTILFVDSAIHAGAGGSGSPGVDGTAGAIGDNGGNGPDYITWVGCTGAVHPGGTPGLAKSAGGAGTSLRCKDIPIAGDDAPGAVATCGKAGGVDGYGCFATGPGCAGGAGTNGAGGAAIGAITVEGYAAAPLGGSGSAGTLGTGGGGGGSGRGKDDPSTPSGTTGGGGGGGGGAGGFGTGATGGTSGGASIGVLASSSSITFVRTPITTKNGGAGGKGGKGGSGGAGGAPGIGGRGNCSGPFCTSANTTAGCDGGQGGRGGDGGNGGGGGGGPTIGVAYHGALPVLDVASTITLGSGGAGGASIGIAGQKGAEKTTLSF